MSRLLILATLILISGCKACSTQFSVSYTRNDCNFEYSIRSIQ